MEGMKLSIEYSGRQSSIKNFDMVWISGVALKLKEAHIMYIHMWTVEAILTSNSNTTSL